MFDQRFERVALRHRHVVTANAVAVSELVDADEIRDGRLQGGGVVMKRAVMRRRCGWADSHKLVVTTIAPTGNGCQAVAHEYGLCQLLAVRLRSNRQPLRQECLGERAMLNLHSCDVREP